MAPTGIKNCSDGAIGDDEIISKQARQRADERRTQDALEDDEVRESLKRLRNTEKAHRSS
jgi:hypothetical protein